MRDRRSCGILGAGFLHPAPRPPEVCQNHVAKSCGKIIDTVRFPGYPCGDSDQGQKACEELLEWRAWSRRTKSLSWGEVSKWTSGRTCFAGGSVGSLLLLMLPRCPTFGGWPHLVRQ